MRSRRILIAYQDDLWVKSLSTFFHGIRYRVETARAVSDLIRRVRNGKVQVVLMDDEVEGVKAWDVVSLIKRINSRVQVTKF
ncbi:MAG: hypothetical protein ACPL6D_01465 [Thermodesulfobacteriota bacterium]